MRAYYESRLREFGPVALGVDWRDEASQLLRFRQFLPLVLDAPDCHLVDLGCGYGALLPFLRGAGFTGRYLGLDVAPGMVEAAQRLHSADRGADFAVGAEPPACDVVVASGIFNVRRGMEPRAWSLHVLATLDRICAVAGVGFAVNFLSSYSDPDRMRPDLYYAEPGRILDRCRRKYSRHLSLSHDYGLYEFTVIARREPRTA